METPNKILGLLHGQIGDQFIQLPLVKHIKGQNKNIEYTANINKKYVICMETLANTADYIDNYYVSDDYESFPNEVDKENLDKLGFNQVFNPMSRHNNENWFRERHQTSEIFDMFGFKFDPNGYQIDLNYPKDQIFKKSKWIAFAPNAGYYNPNNSKKLSESKSLEICDSLSKLGYKILQIGGSDEPIIDHKNVYKLNGSYYDSVLAILSCDLYIGTDTGMTWCISGFKFPTLGLYSDSYYSKDFIKNIQPINPNSIYLSENNVNEISNDLIIEQIKNFKL